MQRSGKRGKYRTPYSRAPAGYSRARAQRAGGRRRRQARQFRVGYDRTGGFYGRYTSGGERKFFDTDVSLNPVTAALVVNNLTIVPEGNRENNRIGRKITVTNIHIRGAVSLLAPTVATNSSSIVIGMLVQDTQTNGAAFTATDLLETDAFTSFANLANSQRFKILKKKVWNLSSGGGAPSGAAFVMSEDNRYVSCNLKCNIPIEYDNSATTGVVTSVRSNNLYWVTQSDNAAGITQLNARIRYTDH